MADLLFLELIKKELEPYKAKLVAVSKTKSAEEIKQIYNAGHKTFGENYVQELTEKHQQLPDDIEWHFIGHLQSNKVKYIAPFISCIQSVDSINLLKEINKQAEKNERIINCLLQIHIAEEETKFGLSFEECEKILESPEIISLKNINILGLMGMSTLTENQNQIRKEFRSLKTFYSNLQTKYKLNEVKSRISAGTLNTLSMGMTSDYKIALEGGSNMIRIGSAIFGERV